MQLWNSSLQSMSPAGLCLLPTHFSALMPGACRESAHTLHNRQAQLVPWRASPVALTDTESCMLWRGSQPKLSTFCTVLCTVNEASSAGAGRTREFLPVSWFVVKLQTSNTLGLMLIVHTWCAKGSFFSGIISGESVCGLYFSFLPPIFLTSTVVPWCLFLSNSTLWGLYLPLTVYSLFRKQNSFWSGPVFLLLLYNFFLQSN